MIFLHLLKLSGQSLLRVNITKQLQIKSNKIEDLPSVLIVLAKSNQFVSDVSEGMTMLKNKYKGNFPTNITTLNVKNKLNEDNFLTYGNSAKDIYLILSDD